MSISEKGFCSGLSMEEVVDLKNTFLRTYDAAMGDAVAPPAARRQALATKHLAAISRLVRA